MKTDRKIEVTVDKSITIIADDNKTSIQIISVDNTNFVSLELNSSQLEDLKKAINLAVSEQKNKPATIAYRGK